MSCGTQCRPHAPRTRAAMRVAVGTGIALGASACNRPAQRFTIACDPRAEAPRLEVTLDARGLAASDGPWTLILDGWGGWPELESGYVSIEAAEPPLGERNGTAFPVLAPPGWDGSLHVEYSLPLLPIGSEEQQARSILPAADGEYALAALANTVMRLERGGEPLGGARTVTITGPGHSAVFTGWAGGATGSQTSDLPPIGDNAVYAIGTPAAVARAEENGLTFEVYQFAPGAGAAPKVLEITRAFVAHVARTLDRPPPGPVRVCISGTTGGGFLTDHGLVVGVPPGSPDWLFDSPYYRHLVCHELFHIWNGHLLEEADAEATVWFKEGFTEYLSLWHAAASGVLPRDWFVTRMLEIAQGAASSSLGSVAFADPGVHWRDGDGPNEAMAYKGGAVLAFALDTEMRVRGMGGLPVLLREMLAPGQAEYSAESIRERLRSMGLDDFDRRFVAGTEVPSVAGLLLSVGCEGGEAPAELAYVGVRAEPGAGLGRIVEIDPDGPAVGAGFLVGDVIGGLAPARGDQVTVSESVSTPYRFGLDLIAPSDEPVSIWVHRGADPIELKVTPRLIAGGLRSEIRMTPHAEGVLFAEP